MSTATPSPTSAAAQDPAEALVLGSTQIIDTFAEALNRTERQLIMLFYAERLTPAEIGLVLRMGEGRVNAMLEDIQHRARRALTRCQPA